MKEEENVERLFASARRASRDLPASMPAGFAENILQQHRNRARLFHDLRRGRSRDMLIQHARNCLLGGRSDHALFLSAVLEKNQSRDAFDPEALRY